ncbi:hypothetical protein [Nocardia sp. NBC_01329]|uniref:hypothetical protein n=1 Tax=Nocardia sp. NBC_01329 TaxID=2903594 RepID=UPI002E0E09AC|nr:hypothetical protein OG405_28645 [Nocardia sp. NBC_01329]
MSARVIRIRSRRRGTTDPSLSKSARSRWIRRAAVIFSALFVVPALLGASALAASGETESVANAGFPALNWMNIRDSSGVELTHYRFVATQGSLFEPLQTAIAVVLGLEFAGYIVIVTGAIWLIGYTMSFHWLDPVGEALSGVAGSLDAQIATPLLLIVAASIGAFFVAWFVLRGQRARAVTQAVTMVGVAVIGPTFTAQPLEDVLSSHGLMSQGRDLGISVAAGLTGQAHADPTGLVATMQESLADNFARHQLQVWNFGHVIDDRAGCADAWSAGMRSGSDSAVVSGLRNCGDLAAQQAALNPTMGQVGSGLVMLICAAILLAFGAYLSVKIIWAALDSIFHGFAAIFGFAAGGFIYGPTQTFLVRNLVDSFYGAAVMAVYIIYLGLYVLFLGNLFDRAGGQATLVLILGAVVQTVALFQFRRLSAALHQGNEWIVNRFALALQQAPGGGGGGGASALGMGASGLGNAGVPGLGLLAGAAALSTLNNNPASAWLFNRVSPLDPHSWKRQRAMSDQWAAWNTRWNGEKIGGSDGLFTHAYLDRLHLSHAARDATAVSLGAGRGGVNTTRGAAAAVDGVLVGGGGFLGQVAASLRGSGFTDEDMIQRAVEARGYVVKHAGDVPLADKNLAEVVAASNYSAAMNTPAAAAELERAVLNYSLGREGIQLRGAARDAGEDYLAAPSRAKLTRLQQVAAGEETAGYSEAEAARALRWIGDEHARRVSDTVTDLVSDPSAENRRRFYAAQNAAVDTDYWAAKSTPLPASALAPGG